MARKVVTDRGPGSARYVIAGDGMGPMLVVGIATEEGGMVETQLRASDLADMLSTGERDALVATLAKCYRAALIRAGFTEE